MTMDRWLQSFLAAGSLAAAASFADGFRIDFPVMAWIFSALMAGAVAWAWSGRAGGRVGGPIVVILLEAMELSGVAFTFARPASTLEVAIYWAFGILAVACIVAALGVIVVQGRARGLSRAGRA